MRVVLSLLLAVLAFGTTAGAGPLGVSMGDSINPKEGWTEGYGVEKRLYSGALQTGSTFISIEGTLEHGACSVEVRPLLYRYAGDIGGRLERKYGRPFSAESEIPGVLVSEALWVLSGNPDRIARIQLSRFAEFDIGLKYFFENYTECEKAKDAGEKAAREAARKVKEAVENAKEAAEKARSRRIDAEL